MSFGFAPITPAPERDDEGSGDFTLYFQWPVAYLDLFDFVVQESPDLVSPP